MTIKRGWERLLLSSAIQSIDKLAFSLPWLDLALTVKSSSRNAEKIEKLISSTSSITQTNLYVVVKWQGKWKSNAVLENKERLW